MLKHIDVAHLYFDLDHTLWDFETNSKSAFETILNSHAFPFTVDAFMKVYTPNNHKYWKAYRENRIDTQELRYLRLSATFNTLKTDVSDQTIHQLSEAYIQELSNFTALFPGTVEVLGALKKKYHLHIITNGFDAVQYKKLENSQLKQFFTSVTTAEAVGCKKPQPEIFEKARRKEGVAPHQAVMIGDSLEADILGGLKDGMQAIHFNSHHEPEHDKCPIIYDLSELQSLLLPE